MAKKDISSKNTTAFEIAYDYIKERILNMVYKPGETLSEAKISKELDLSRTPIREAINALVNEGLVHNVPGQGKSIYTMGLHDIEEIFDIKIAVESMIIKQVAERRTDKDLKKLETILKEMEKAAKENSVENWLKADKEFHYELFQIAENERAYNMIKNLNEQWHRIKVGFLAMEQRLKVSIKEHKMIYECIKKGDGEGAKKNMKEHLTKLSKKIITLITHIVIPYVGENL